MKKFSILTLGLVLTLCLTACGRKNNTTAPTTVMPTTEMIILPDPTIETNIPDPSVDTSMPMYTEGTGSTTETQVTTDDMGRSRNR